MEVEWESTIYPHCGVELCTEVQTKQVKKYKILKNLKIKNKMWMQ